MRNVIILLFVMLFLVGCGLSTIPDTVTKSCAESSMILKATASFTARQSGGWNPGYSCFVKLPDGTWLNIWGHS